MKGAGLIGLMVLALGACSSPRANVYADPSGEVTTSASTGVGPVRVGVNSSGGGYVGTKIGWLGIAAGF
ncbi:hypothetical protein SAMN05877809_10813 [Rhodobacter sp. JA431]|uniref:hypothetical protein n=1 Tax=Rhodobacter sp. JA431 TaxID=570013 RepID=UPI000BD84E89|nr:hypothetical protein [Rhodobacter sp. JA431]SOC15507.1 hypothetical protein SAMN05877809_10813 [Rhodobacter sp. JA431]